MTATDTARGFAIWFDRETWGIITDALIEHRASAQGRKAANAASTSDVRAEMCAEAIAEINHAGRTLR
jgi:hypothetical protein